MSEQRVRRTGVICDPSGWVGNYPVGELCSGIRCHSFGCMDQNQGDNHTDEALIAETLVEEVSIDGMCGVY